MFILILFSKRTSDHNWNIENHILYTIHIKHCITVEFSKAKRYLQLVRHWHIFSNCLSIPQKVVSRAFLNSLSCKKKLQNFIVTTSDTLFAFQFFSPFLQMENTLCRNFPLFAKLKTVYTYFWPLVFSRW